MLGESRLDDEAVPRPRRPGSCRMVTDERRSTIQGRADKLVTHPRAEHVLFHALLPYSNVGFKEVLTQADAAKALPSPRYPS